MDIGSSTPRKRASTGIAGLDEILNGGLPCNYIYLVQGKSGSGKTTLGLQFALAGVEAGETVLYITLSETERELEQIASSHGWSLEGLHVHELRPAEAIEAASAEQTIFHPADVELGEAMDQILKRISELQPDRAVFDSITEIHLLAETPLRFRRQLLALRQVLVEIDCTALLMNNEPMYQQGSPIQSLVHGQLDLEQLTMEYSEDRRRLRVDKMRGMPYHEGYHDFRIVTGGIEVYCRLKLADGEQAEAWTPKTSGLTQLDTMLGEGLPSGTSCLIVGQSGTGKSSLTTLYVHAATQRDEAAMVCIFDERRETFYQRAAGLGLDLQGQEETGLIILQQINAGEISPGEFTHNIRRAVEMEQVKLVVIDSLTGYLKAMPEERLLLIHLHELLIYLSQQDVLTLLTLTHHGLLVSQEAHTIDLSYLTDTVLLLRHFEARGEVRQAISVIKKRHGPHERTVRELHISADGLKVGQPLTAFSGVLSGQLRFEGEPEKLLDGDQPDGNDGQE